MQLDKHIAKRFLTDPMLTMEIIEHTFPDAAQAFETGFQEKKLIRSGGYTMEVDEVTLKNKVASLYHLLETPKGHKPFYCTETMLDCLEHLKVHKNGEHYNWTYFDSLPDQRATFIFPDNKMLRMAVVGEVISFCHVAYTPYDKERGNVGWVLFWLNRKTGELCDHFGHKDVVNIEKFVYSLLCFVYMADNEEVIVPAGSRYGTRKSGKLINSTPFPITVINSKWNVTSIRNEGFAVSAHFAIRYTGKGRTVPRIVFIDAFEKKGYTRHGKPEEFNSPSNQKP